MKKADKNTGKGPERTEGVYSFSVKGMVRPWMKTIALVLICTFLSQQISVGQQAPPAAQPIVNGRIDLNQVSIPRDIAITKEIYRTASNELIINIKDVHDNYGVQESIVSVLENLAMNYDVRFVGIEGSEGYIDMSLLSSFPDKEATKLAAGYMMKRGRISAGEFFASVSESPVMLYGIDDSDLYIKNYNAFRDLLLQKDRNRKLVDSLRRALYALEDHVFSEELKQLNRNSVLNNTTGKGFTSRWYFIADIGTKHGIGYGSYRNVNALIKAVELEKKIDYAATNRQRDEVLDILTRKLERDRMEELILKSLSFKLGKISKSQFYSYLLLLARAEDLDVKHYGELAKFCEYVNLYESIDITELMDEIDDYECRIKDRLYRNGDERKLTALMKDMEILHNVFAVKLTSGQLRYFRSHMEDFTWRNFLDFIKEKYAEYGIPLPADLAEAADLFRQLPRAVDFYEAATGRNEAMVENTIKLMRQNNVTVGAIITGGFHSKGITDILKSDKVSFMILLPRFNPQTGKRPYITILTNKEKEYEHYTKSGEYLAVTSFFALDRRILANMGLSERDAEIEKARFSEALDYGCWLLRAQKEGPVNENLKKMMEDRAVSAYRARQRDLLVQGLITQEKFDNNVGILESVIGDMHTVAREDGGVEVFFAMGEEGNFKYTLSFADKEGTEVTLKAWDEVPGEEVERVVFQQSLMRAETAGIEAMEKGRELLDKVSGMKIQAIARRLEHELRSGIMREAVLSDEDITSTARKLGWRELTADEIGAVKKEMEPMILAEARQRAEEKAAAEKAAAERAEAERAAAETAAVRAAEQAEARARREELAKAAEEKAVEEAVKREAVVAERKAAVEAPAFRGRFNRFLRRIIDIPVLGNLVNNLPVLVVGSTLVFFTGIWGILASTAILASLSRTKGEFLVGLIVGMVATPFLLVAPIIAGIISSSVPLVLDLMNVGKLGEVLRRNGVLPQRDLLSMLTPQQWEKLMADLQKKPGLLDKMQDFTARMVWRATGNAARLTVEGFLNRAEDRALRRELAETPGSLVDLMGETVVQRRRAMKRMGQEQEKFSAEDEDAFLAEADRAEAAGEKKSVEETVRGRKISAEVVYGDLKGQAGAYHMRKGDRLIIVIDSTFRGTAKEGEAVYHEACEVYWKDQGRSDVDAHRLASAMQVLRFSASGELTPYHLSQVTEDLSEAELRALLTEDRSEVLDLIGRELGAAERSAIENYEANVRAMAGARLARLAEEETSVWVELAKGEMAGMLEELTNPSVTPERAAELKAQLNDKLREMERAIDQARSRLGDIPTGDARARLAGEIDALEADLASIQSFQPEIYRRKAAEARVEENYKEKRAGNLIALAESSDPYTKKLARDALTLLLIDSGIDLPEEADALLGTEAGRRHLAAAYMRADMKQRKMLDGILRSALGEEKGSAVFTGAVDVTRSVTNAINREIADSEAELSKRLSGLASAGARGNPMDLDAQGREAMVIELELMQQRALLSGLEKRLIHLADIKSLYDEGTGKYEFADIRDALSETGNRLDSALGVCRDSVGSRVVELRKNIPWLQIDMEPGEESRVIEHEGVFVVITAEELNETKEALKHGRFVMRQDMARTCGDVAKKMKELRKLSIRNLLSGEAKRTGEEVKRRLEQWVEALRYAGVSREELAGVSALLADFSFKNARDIMAALQKLTAGFLKTSGVAQAELIERHVGAVLFELSKIVNPEAIGEDVGEITDEQKLKTNLAVTEKFVAALEALKGDEKLSGMIDKDMLEGALRLAREIRSNIEEQIKTGENRSGEITTRTKELIGQIRDICYGGSKSLIVGILKSKLGDVEITQARVSEVLEGLGVTGRKKDQSITEVLLTKETDEDKINEERFKNLAGEIQKYIATGLVGTDAFRDFFGESAEVDKAVSDISVAVRVGEMIKDRIRGPDRKGYESAGDNLEQRLNKNFEDREARTELAAWYQLAAIVTTGMSPFVEQVEAGFFMADSFFVDIATGAGKTLAFPVPNIMNRARGLKSVHFVTDDYFTERDFRETRYLYEMMGYKVDYMGGDEKELGEATRRIEENDVVIMSYGAFSFTCLDAVKDKTRPASRRWFSLLKKTRLTFDECDVAPYLSDFIIAAQQNRLSVREYMRYLALIKAAERLYREGKLKTIISQLESNMSAVDTKASREEMEGQVEKLRDMLGLEEGGVAVRDGKLFIRSREGERELSPQELKEPKFLTIEGQRFVLTHTQKAGFVVKRTEFVGEEVKDAKGAMIDTTAQTVRVDDGTWEVVSAMLRDVSMELAEMFPGFEKEKFGRDEFVDCVKALYVDKLGVNYVLEYREVLGSKQIILSEKDGDILVQDKEGKEYPAEFQASLQEDGSFRVTYRGEERALLNDGYFKDENGQIKGDQDVIVHVGEKRYRVKARTEGGYTLQEVAMEVVLVDEQTSRRQGGQRKDRFHTFYEMKHQLGEDDMPDVRSDNKSTEFLSFTDVTDFVHSIGGASGSVATAAYVMNRIFGDKSRGVVRMNPAFSKKGSENPPIFISSQRGQWDMALNRIKDIYRASPGASMILYYDDIHQAEAFQKELEEMIKKEGLEATAGGEITVQIFKEEGAKENELVTMAGNKNTITLSDAKLGRATNVVLSEVVGFIAGNSARALKDLLSRRMRGADKEVAEFFRRFLSESPSQEIEQLKEILRNKGLTSEEVEANLEKMGRGETVDSSFRGAFNEALVGLLTDMLAGRDGIFFMDDFGRRAERRNQIEGFLKRLGAGETSEVWRTVKQKYSDGLFLIDLSPDLSDQGKVQKFGRNRRQGDVGYVDSFYSLQKGGKFYRMVEKMYSPVYNADLTPDEKEEGQRKFQEFLTNAEALESLQKSILEGGRFRDDLSEQDMEEFVSLQGYFTGILAEVRTGLQRKRDEDRIKRAERDRKTQRLLDRVRDLPVAFYENIKKDPFLAGEFLRDRVDSILDRYVTDLGEAVDSSGVVDLEECLGVMEEHFHVDLGSDRLKGLQASLEGKSARELAEVRRMLRNAVLGVLESMGSVALVEGEGELMTGNVSYKLRIDENGFLRITGVEYVHPDGKRVDVEVRTSADGSALVIGEEVYRVGYDEDGSMVLAGGEGRQMRFNRSMRLDGTEVIEMEGGLVSAVMELYGEGLDRLKTKVIKEAREKGPDGVQTDMGETGLAQAAIEESVRRFRDRRDKAEDYKSREGRETLRKAIGRVDGIYDSMAEELERVNFEAERQRKEQAKDENYRVIDKDVTVRRGLRQAGEEVAADMRAELEVEEEVEPEEARLGEEEPAQVMVAEAADTSARKYSVSVDFAGLMLDTPLQRRDAERSREIDQAVEEQGKEAKDREEAAKKSAVSHEEDMEPVPAGEDLFVAVDKEKGASLSDAECVQGITAGIPAPGPGGEPGASPRMVIVTTAGALEGMNDSERQKVAAALHDKYAAFAAPGQTLYIKFDGLGEGSLDEATGRITPGFTGVKIFDQASFRALSEAREEAGKEGTLSQDSLEKEMDLSSEKGERVFIKKAGGTNFLVTVADDGAAYVRYLGPKVYVQTRREVLRANSVLSARDPDIAKAGLRPEEFMLTPQGVFIQTGGEPKTPPVVDLLDIIANNKPEAAEIERLPLTKEEGLPLPGWRGGGFTGKMRFIGRKLSEGAGWLKWKAIGAGRWLIKKKDRVKYRFDLSLRGLDRFSSLKWGSLRFFTLPVSVAQYFIQDALRDFSMWGQRSKAFYKRALEQAKTRKRRSALYNGLMYRLENVSPEKKFVKFLAKTAAQGDGASCQSQMQGERS